jgi:hypothetical protein
MVRVGGKGSRLRCSDSRQYQPLVRVETEAAGSVGHSLPDYYAGEARVFWRGQDGFDFGSGEAATRIVMDDDGPFSRQSA